MATFDNDKSLILCDSETSEGHPLYDGFKPGSEVLKQGSQHIPGGLALPCDILYERDIAVKLRDGTTIYVDVYRPPTAPAGQTPSIVSAGPFGKRGGFNRMMFGQMPWRGGVPQETVSGLEKFEGLDPAYWCHHGYAIVAPDVRGCWKSEGNTYVNCTSDGRDGYDLVEWIAAQPWSNQRVSYAGNSWLSQTQWFIGAERPPHLTCLAPWEGWHDLYEDDAMRGGIPRPQFQQFLLMTCSPSLGKTEDMIAMAEKHPLMDDYWRDRSAKVENIDIPMYVAASWTNELHTRGTFKGYLESPSKNKWLRVHNTHEWPDLYYPQNTEDLRKFFDHYLKGVQNDWEHTPKVRMCVLNPGGEDIINRPEAEFPLARTKPTKMFLDAAKSALTWDQPIAEPSSVKFEGAAGQVTFEHTFAEATELTGFSSLRLWVEATEADDLDLYTKWVKLSPSGEPLDRIAVDPGYLKPDPQAEREKLLAVRRGPPGPEQGMVANFFSEGPNGQLRVSHRELDEDKSTALWPRYKHQQLQKIKPGEVVPVTIEIWPHGMLFAEGEKLRLTVSGRKLNPEPFNLDPELPPNKGDVVIHAGGEYDSYLLVPHV